MESSSRVHPHTTTYPHAFSMGPVQVLQNFLDFFFQIFNPCLIEFGSMESRL